MFEVLLFFSPPLSCRIFPKLASQMMLMVGLEDESRKT